MNKLYTTSEMVTHLFENQNSLFKRYNDDKFIVSMSVRGFVMCTVNTYSMPLAIGLYKFEKWIYIGEKNRDVEEVSE